MMKDAARKEFENELQAWNWIHSKFVNKQWYYDDIASEKTGYNIYRDTEEYYNYICCLGDRLEVNLKKNNQTINLWIKSDLNNSKDDEFECREAYATFELGYSEIDRICKALYMCSLASSTDDMQKGTFNNVDSTYRNLELIMKLQKGKNN